jgi:hypothetical protein
MAHPAACYVARVLIQALTGVPTDDLKKALLLLHRGELNFPLTALEVTRTGLHAHSEALLAHLRGLDANGVRAVLTAVLSERMQPR